MKSIQARRNDDMYRPAHLDETQGRGAMEKAARGTGSMRAHAPPALQASSTC
jgi:hypothetical protein